MKISIQSLTQGSVNRLMSAGLPLAESMEVRVLSLSGRGPGGIVCPVGHPGVLLVCTNVSEVSS